MRFNIPFPFILSWIFMLSLGCGSSSENNSANLAYTDSLSISHAKGFSVYYANDFVVVQVLNPDRAEIIDTYYLTASDDLEPDSKFLSIPMQQLVCMSTSHIPLLDYLEASEHLVGFPNPDHISSPTMRSQINAGKVSDVGLDTDINMEVLMTLQPNAVMAYEMPHTQKQNEFIESTGIPVILNHDFLEKTPLGRAEWIKFMGVFLQKEALATQIFDGIRKRYDSLSQLAKGVQQKPTVMCGIMYGDVWYVPGGNSWVAQFIEDAGGDYLWKEDSTFGSLALGFESVLEKAQKADVWINVGSYQTLESLREASQHYTHFQSFSNQSVYGYNAKIGEKGGNEYLELGYLRPDLILADLIHIFHPKVLQSYDAYFYEKLK